MAKRGMVALGLLALVGCNPAATTNDAGTSPGTDSGPPPGADAGPPRGGMVQIVAIPTGASLSGLFGDFDPMIFETGPIPGCTSTMFGSCYAIQCPPMNPPPPTVGAGDLTISWGGSTQITSMPTVMSGSTQYSGMAMPGPAAGTTIDVAATGGVVPAFTGSVTMPDTLTGTVPATAPVGSDLVVSWTAPAVGSRVAFIVLPSGGGPMLTCMAPAASGTLTVPSGALAAMGAGSYQSAMAAVDSTDVTAGDYHVRLRAMTTSLFPITLN